MKTKIIFFSAILFSLPTLSSAALECNGGELAIVSGNVATNHISPSEQLGTIQLVLQENGDIKENHYGTNFKKGHKSETKIVFAGEGEIYGQIVAQENVSTWLNHSITFDNGENALYTQNDHAIALMPPLAFDEIIGACKFNVIEQVTNFDGVGIFAGATGYITAQGVVNFCPQDLANPPHNTFTLSGELCLIKHHH
ncbi:MAG: hypothetical protein OEY38_12820 [Gammaproteobacteria bacterium]|nr:hypothetical protein [Gammaproteobacteria bacterium]